MPDAGQLGFSDDWYPMINPPVWNASALFSGLRSATISYYVALGLIGVLAAISTVTLKSMIHQQVEAAREGEVAKRLLSLSQRAGLLAASLAVEQDEVRRIAQERDLHAVLDFMEADLFQNRQTLAHMEKDYLEGRSDISAGALPPPLLPGKNEGDDAATLEASITQFIATGHALLKLPAEARADSALKRQILDAARNSVARRLVLTIEAHNRHVDQAIDFLQETLSWTLFGMLLTLAAEVTLIFRPMFRRLSTSQSELLEAATTDPMTGCLNRRGLMEKAALVRQRTRAGEGHAAVLLLDIDRFKVINDTWGHAAGDDAIRALALMIGRVTRSGDLIARLGGDEFAIILPDSDTNAALFVAAKLRQVAASQRISVPQIPQDFTISISIGATLFSPLDNGMEETLDRADKAMYLAKRAGRDCAKLLLRRPDGRLVDTQGKLFEPSAA